MNHLKHLRYALMTLTLISGLNGTSPSITIETVEDPIRQKNGSYVLVADKTTKQLNELQNQPKTKRLLSFTGGGTKGLLPAVMLAYFEDVINAEFNKKRRNQILKSLGRSEETTLYIRDLFDGAAGTSTGGILATGLFFNAPIDINKPGQETSYSAIEIAQIYARHCDTLFGLSTLNTITTKSFCDVTPLAQLFSIYFGEVNMETAFKEKHVEVYAYNPENKMAVQLSKQNYGTTSVACCVRATSSVPWLYPAAEITIGENTLKLQDGGLRTNFPGYQLLEGQRNQDGFSFYELFAFGTGKSSQKAEDSLWKTIGKFAKNIVAGPVSTYEQEDLTNCEKAIRGRGNPLSFFAHINPKLEEGMNLASSGPNFVRNAIRNALNETHTEAFKKVITQLGFIAPNDVQSKTLESTVRQKIEAFDMDIFSCPDHIENGKLSRETEQKRLLINYIERQIVVYKNYDVLINGFFYKKTEEGVEKVEGENFLAFLNLLKINSDNQEFKKIIDHYIKAKPSLENLTSFTQDEWDYLIANNSLSDSIKTMTDGKVVKSINTSSSSGQLTPTSTPKLEATSIRKSPTSETLTIVCKQGDEDFVITSLSEYDEKLNILFSKYISFLESAENKQYDNSTTPCLADLFLSKILKDVDIKVGENTTIFIKSLGNIIAYARNITDWPTYIARTAASIVGSDAGNTRWSELYGALDRRLKLLKDPICEIIEEDSIVSSS